MPLPQPLLACESIVLTRVFDAAADCPGVDVTIWEHEQPTAIAELYTWAADRQLDVTRRTYPKTQEPLSDTGLVHEVTINDTNTITVYEK